MSTALIRETPSQNFNMHKPERFSTPGVKRRFNNWAPCRGKVRTQRKVGFPLVVRGVGLLTPKYVADWLIGPDKPQSQTGRLAATTTVCSVLRCIAPSKYEQKLPRTCLVPPEGSLPTAGVAECESSHGHDDLLRSPPRLRQSR